MRNIFKKSALLIALMVLFHFSASAYNHIGVAAATYDVGSVDNPGSGSKFAKYTDGLYMWRAASNHSYSKGTGAGKGIKTQN